MNMLLKAFTPMAGLMTVASLTGTADAARLPVVPSPTNFDNPVVIQRVDVNKLSQPILVAERPRQEVARGDGNSPQPPNNLPIVRPYGENAASVISDLELRKRENNQQLNEGLQNHNQSQNDALQKILDRTKK
jgi:hypothetical protein